MSRSRIAAPNAWRTEDFQQDREWSYELTQSDRVDIKWALKNACTSGLTIPFGAGQFPLGAFGEQLKRLRVELEEGSGVMFLRGLEIDDYGLEGTRTVYWGIGAHLGVGLAQNPRGDLLVNVRDEGGDPYLDPTQRGYHTAQRLPFHNDQGDVVGLLCFRSAKAGGLSCICSAAAIHDKMLDTRPDLVEALYGPFYADVRGEEPAGRKPYYVEPRFAVFNGRFYAQHGPTYIRSAQRFPEVPRLTGQQLEAMDMIDTLAASEEFRVDMDFRPGDLQFLNNHLVLHSRTTFEDFAQPELKRHLLRLWLCTPYYKEIPPFFKDRYEDMDFWLRHPVTK
ncbi:TauD/TfdA family dioxygenase [Paraburkholderia caballeronis]|uniref:Taurine catabolism dioxygenase TauD, TfdA family n=1 Tax=Paraburkholderia caballeronis TaxID=416943 RepID=A0A1H7T109_9BURK|nr:TauD/TfdA family dioxygenase [Paraburkholderia caballeronis]PXW25755.1 TfdA family taurine catabolism dioxygenase TauD [Paraburkholderia caballeronis]PXX01362.1 TfdA family taurine catabolism dioxygenase TauD [Paraburkholderia caballeronis]RAJ99284.1 TfdA family taurine catabolism dioxygenase TauD [Paraburkholderia caballeronis]SEE23910.1 Taurine catabolism dioxygenase TauD, TfdA family [Paraburkholderia caballeronis]SEL77934.1 Taurine catabolism dioxygenase TauD, TfdA family [Paraburkholde